MFVSLTLLVLDSTVCPAASASNVSRIFADNGEIKTLPGCDFITSWKFKKEN
jgi:hypothetical protein